MSGNPSRHRVVIVGGGAAGLELATALGNSHGRRGKADITLIDRTRTHVWKPKLHEIAAGSMDMSAHEVGYRAQSHWHHFRFRVGAMVGLDVPVRPQRGQLLVTEKTAPFLRYPVSTVRQTDEGGVMLGFQSEFTPIELPQPQFDAYLEEEGLAGPL